MKQESLSHVVRQIAEKVSQITGLNADEIERDLEPSHTLKDGWQVRFVGPSMVVRLAVKHAIRELRQ
jgi:hypothetical protein